MEQSHHKIEMVKNIILSYLNIPIGSIHFDRRNAPVPTIKKMIGYFSQKHFSATQGELASFLNYKTHSSVSIGISTLISESEHSEKLRTQMKDIDRIIIEKGLSRLSGKNNEWYIFLDLNDFIIATKGTSSVLWHNMTMAQAETILGDGWEFTEHKKTEKFIYKRIKLTKIKNQ